MATNILAWFLLATQFLFLALALFIVVFAGSLVVFWKRKGGVPWVPTGMHKSEHLLKLARVSWSLGPKLFLF